MTHLVHARKVFDIELAALKARLAEAKRLVGITLYDYTNCGGKISRTALEEMRAFLHPEVK